MQVAVSVAKGRGAESSQRDHGFSFWGCWCWDRVLLLLARCFGHLL